jgi:hypothetical protein
MAVEQYGDTWEIVRLNDGKFLITTTAEPAAADEIGFAVEFAGGVEPATINVKDEISTAQALD